MQPVDPFVALYLIGVMVVCLILGIVAYNKKKERGETIE